MIVLQSLEVEEFDLEIQYECDGDCQEGFCCKVLNLLSNKVE